MKTKEDLQRILKNKDFVLTLNEFIGIQMMFMKATKHIDNLDLETSCIFFHKNFDGTIEIDCAMNER